MGGIVDAVKQLNQQLDGTVQRMSKINALRLFGGFGPGGEAIPAADTSRVSSRGAGGSGFTTGSRQQESAARQAAIAAIPNTSGGPVLLGPGTFGIGEVVTAINGLHDTVKDGQSTGARTGGGLG